jgi:hypothetical protein
MKHLLSYSVFQSLDDLSKVNVGEFLKNIGCDGLELFTLYDDVPECYFPYSTSVHLPYAVDWYRGWTGNVDKEKYSRGDLDYITFGIDREEMVSNIRKMIGKAASVDPAYGILHAGSTDLEQVYHRKYVSDDRKVLYAFAEMINIAVSGYKSGEPPFRLAFENLWWSGLKLREPWEYRLIEDKMEFENWCFCLDTGHLMNSLSDAVDETSAIDGAMKIIDRYPQEMRDRIRVMHLHYSASADYRNTFDEKDISMDEGFEKVMGDSYQHVSMIDQHRPFTDRRCLELVNSINPDFVTHEMLPGNGRDMISDFKKQRSLFY